MAFTKIGFDISELTNITAPNISLDQPAEMIINAPVIANEITGHWLGFGIMAVVTLMLYWTFADKTRNGDFLYDDIRAFSLSTGTALNLGVLMLNLELITNIQHVGLFLVFFALSEILILWIERKNDT